MASHNPNLQLLLDRLESGPYELVDLRRLVLQEGGIRYGTSSPPPILPPSEETVPFVRATDIKEGEIQLGGLLHVHRSQSSQMAKCLLSEGEVIVVRSGVNTGDCAPVPASLAGAYGAYDLILRLRDGEDSAIPRFLTSYLDTGVGRAQLNVLKARSAQPHLNAEEIGSIRVPLPKPPKQRELLAALDAARAARRRKLYEAESILGGLDAFVLEALGITLPPPDSRTTYAVRLRDARKRFDPDYNSPRFRALRSKIEHGKYPSEVVGNLFDPIVSGFAAGGDDQTEDPSVGVPHIRPLNISNTAELHFDGTKMVPREAVQSGDFLKRGEVLFNNTNSTAWVGKTVVFDIDRECACSNHITRLTQVDKKHSPYYFAALFNALRGLGYFGLLSTNFNNQAGVNVDTLRAVRCPVPDDATQKAIAGEVSRRRAAAGRLREDADKLWEHAKRRFEEELLGPSQ